MLFEPVYTPSAVMVEHLRTVFSQFGNPEMILCENAAYFTGEKFTTVRVIHLLLEGL